MLRELVERVVVPVRGKKGSFLCGRERERKCGGKDNMREGGEWAV